ncbi:hypothetical protein BDV18DRAFT_162361 [Aspergillus unguis]
MGTSRNAASSSSTESDTSRSTALTEYSYQPTSKQCHEDEIDETDLYDEIEVDPADSASTLESTGSSIEDIEEPPLLGVMDRKRNVYLADAIPSSSSTFGKLFPSGRRCLIRHDDMTLDGNMNLTVNTMVPNRSGHMQDVILFHLRMRDLYTRDFSFRRYCRESGREVCHSKRKTISSHFSKPPMLQRSWNSVLASLRPGSAGQGAISAPHKRRRSEQSEAEDEGAGIIGQSSSSIMLEFSNYAHVELKRKSVGITKRYEYEYWGTKYQWRRQSHREGGLHQVSYHLTDMRESRTIAHVVPEILTPSEAIEEESKGGWIPPSSIWISDARVYRNMHDIADVIVATGLIGLVDDTIRDRLDRGTSSQFTFPLRSSLSQPKRLIDNVLHRV